MMTRLYLFIFVLTATLAFALDPATITMTAIRAGYIRRMERICHAQGNRRRENIYHNFQLFVSV